jgi:hypothetical protein
MNLKINQSPANRVWLGVFVIVTIVLFAQTRGPKEASYNLILEGNPESIGASVYLDGQNVGSLKNSTASGLEGAIYWGKAANGEHLLEVKKPNYKTFSKQFDMHCEEYLSVDLERTKE